MSRLLKAIGIGLFGGTAVALVLAALISALVYIMDFLFVLTGFFLVAAMTPAGIAFGVIFAVVWYLDA